MTLQFDIPKPNSSIIKVIGVGGGGGNAVNHMYRQGIKGVDFIVCNTDAQALEMSPVPTKIRLGNNLTEGRGAGSNPEVGRLAALETTEELKELLANNTKMVFVTAGMGGGTGTGAAPVIAQIAREMGILTVGIVTIPFKFEGRRRISAAHDGLENLKDAVDTILVINNEKLRELFANFKASEAFAQADNVLATAAKGIAEIITVPGYINVDFEDVKTVMADSGVAIMGAGMAEGEDRAKKAVEAALHSPLLSENNIFGAKYILLNISYGSQEILFDEINTITDYIQDTSGPDSDMIWGHCFDESLGDAVMVTLIATGFDGQEKPARENRPAAEEAPQAAEATPLEYQIAIAKTGEAEPAAAPTQPVDEKPEGPATPVQPRQANFFTEPPKPAEAPQHAQAPMGRPRPAASPATPVPLENAVQSVAAQAKHRYRLGEEDKEHEQAIDKATRERHEKISTPKGLAEIESKPAYIRRAIELQKVPSSSESNLSRYMLEDDAATEEPSIKQKNSYLHDNVD